MLEKSLMYLIFKGAALAASLLFLQKAGAGLEFIIILALAFLCIFLFEYILGRIPILYTDKIIFLLNGPLLLILFLWNETSMFPLFILLLLFLIDSFTKGEYFYSLSLSFVFIMAILMEPEEFQLAVSLVLMGLLCYNRLVRKQAETFRNQLMEQKEELALLNQKLQDNKRLTRNLQYMAALEERNRLAARLHDKVGHGISGSIILLEASRLILDKNPEKAKEGMDKAVHNLRTGVDEIRMALREERPVRSDIGILEIETLLERFQENHSIAATLVKTGNLECIGVGIWQCIYDNLEEVLTNILKHSNATSFTLSIQILPKIIRIEYGDNGQIEGNFIKGLGMEVIEERTIKCRGRCFFEKDEKSFRVINVFVYD